MPNISIDDAGCGRFFSSELKQILGAKEKKGNNNTGGTRPPLTINELPFDITKVLYNAKYTGTTINNVLDLPNTDFLTYGGLLWFKALNEEIPHAMFLVSSGTYGNMLNLPSNNPVTQTNKTEISLVTKTSLVLKGNAEFVNKAGVDYQLLGFVNRKNFFYSTVITHTNGQSEKIPLNGRIAVPGAIIIKSNDIAAKWTMWHRSFGNSAYLTFNESYAKSAGSIVTVNASNEIVIDPNLISGDYTIIVFGHSKDGSDGIIVGDYAMSNTKQILPFEPGVLFTKKTDSNDGNNNSDPWLFMNHKLGWFSNQNDNFLTHQNSILQSGACGGPTPDGFITPTLTGQHLYIAIKKGV